MNWFTDAHWLAKTLAMFVGSAFLFSCLGWSGPILADTPLVDWLFNINVLLFVVAAVLIEIPQFFLFVYGTTIITQMAIEFRLRPTFSLSMLLKCIAAFAMTFAIFTNEWNTYTTRDHDWVDYISPVWLIEGPFATNIILTAGPFCGAFGLVHLISSNICRMGPTSSRADNK